jgi:hypothetical protein
LLKMILSTEGGISGPWVSELRRAGEKSFFFENRISSCVDDDRCFVVAFLAVCCLMSPLLELDVHAV